MNKKNLLMFLLVFVFLVTISVGCSSNNTTNNDSTTSEKKNSTNETKAEPKEEAVLTYWTWGDYLNGDDSFGMQIINEFNEKHKGEIRIEARFIPGKEYPTAIQAAIASNELPDVFEKHNSLPISLAVDENLLLPLDDIISDDFKNQFAEGALAEGITMIDGKIYTLPRLGPELMYILHFNKDVMKNAGLDPETPPKSWDELRSMSKTVTEQGNGDVYGLVFPKYAERIVGGLSQGVSSKEGSPFNYATGEYNFNKKPFIDSVNFLLDMREDGTILPSSYSASNPEAGALFGEGKAAFLFEARFRMWQLKRDTPDANFGLSYIPTPDGKPPVHGYSVKEIGFVVSANTKYPKEAGIFLEEGISSKKFHEKSLQAGVVLTPMPEVNKDESNYLYPEMFEWVKLHEDLLVTEPNAVVRNSEITKLYTEIGGIDQNVIKPTAREILLSLIMGAEEDVEGSLNTYNDRVNKGLNDGIEKLKGAGVDVDKNDFIFPNWDPNKNYTTQDYQNLK